MTTSTADLAHRRFSLVTTVRLWFRDSVRYRGVWATVNELSVRVSDFVRDLTPSRRRLRYGDLQYDFDNRVDTTWSNIRLGTRMREVFAGEQYQPIQPEQFHGMIEDLGVYCSEFTFVDLGSGKGRALLLASEYPFRRIIGVEVLPELHRIARENIGKFPWERQRCRLIECLCGDARDFEFPPGPIFLYLFNPFFEPVFEQVLQNLSKSLREHPRKVLLLYVNPLSESLVRRCEFLLKIAGTHQYSAYITEM